MTTATLERPFLRVTEVARLLGVSRQYVYILMDRGELAYCRFGRCRRVPPAAVEKLVRESTVGAPQT